MPGCCAHKASALFWSLDVLPLEDELDDELDDEELLEDELLEELLEDEELSLLLELGELPFPCGILTALARNDHRLLAYSLTQQPDPADDA